MKRDWLCRILSGAVGLAAWAGEAGKTAGPLSPGRHVFALRVDDLDRRYTVHVPRGYDGKKPVPVVVMLHGGGGSGRGAATETGWDAKADEAGFLAVFPDAQAKDPSKPGRFIGNPQVWNDGSGRFSPEQNKVDDVGFIRAMLDDLVRRFALDEGRVFVTGFSNGASMAFRVAAELAPRVAAVAPVAGACWIDQPAPARPVPLCYITGTDDPLNPIEGGVPKLRSGRVEVARSRAKPPVGDSIRKWVEALGCPAEPAAVSETNGVRAATYGPGREGTEVVYITVAGLGHTWAGGRSILPEFMVGKSSDKIRATDVIWAFFQKHPRKPEAVQSGPAAAREAGAGHLGR